MRMAGGPRSGHIDDDEGIDLRPLLRLAAWGLGATAALGLAVLAARTEIGEQRALAALAPHNGAPNDQTRAAMARLAAKASDAERESLRLAELVRTLTTDRDRLATRVSQLERNFEDLTGSIALTQPSRRPAAVAIAPGATPAPPTTSAPKDEPGAAAGEALGQPASLPRADAQSLPDTPDVATAGPRASITVSPAPSEPGGESIPPEVPLPRPNPLVQAQALAAANAPSARAAGHAAAAGELPLEPPARSRVGVDLGSASSVEGLRVLWARIKDSQPPLVGDLRPLIAVREGGRSGVELRLLAGPLVNHGAATRLCAALTAASIPCRAAAYEGQRLTVP